jgi:hypothetical protein
VQVTFGVIPLNSRGPLIVRILKSATYVKMFHCIIFQMPHIFERESLCIWFLEELIMIGSWMQVTGLTWGGDGRCLYSCGQVSIIRLY